MLCIHRVAPGIIAWRVSPLGADGESRTFTLHVSPDAALKLTGAVSSSFTPHWCGYISHTTMHGRDE